MPYPSQKRRKHTPGVLVTNASSFPSLSMTEYQNLFDNPFGQLGKPVASVPIPGIVFPKGRK